MKILFINGSPNKNGNTKALADVLLNGREYETLNLTDYKIYSYGQNFEEDQLGTVIAKMKEADVIVIGSPLYWHNICGAVRNVLDRFYGLVSESELAGKDMYFLFQGAAPEKWMLEAGEYTMKRFAGLYGMKYKGMATGKAWFKVPSAMKFNLTGKPAAWISGKDIILHIIGMIGVDGALYKSMEFVGDGIRYLTMDDRFTIANMAIEAGGKNGIFPVDDLAKQYMEEHSKRPYVVYEADEDAEYDAEYTIDLSTLKPTVSFPHLPENTRTIDEVGDVKIDQVVIGSCTNGRMDDLRIAASVLKGKKVKKGLRVIVIPATQKIYLQAMEEGLLRTFIEAGAVVSTPTCGPCLGGYMGILAAGERCVSTTNRNFVGRMGHVDSEVYLASPAVAAASAVTGKISSPEEVM